MDDSFISPVVDLFREILYDILGLFVPGAALLLILSHSSFESVQSLVQLITPNGTGLRIAGFVGASYVVGYAIQGFAGHFWSRCMVKVIKWWAKRKLSEEAPKANAVAEQALDDRQGDTELGISPAFRQVKESLEKSEMITVLRTRLRSYCQIDHPERLSLNEIEHLCYAIAGDRADDAFAFSFRADLSNGMFFVSVLAFFHAALAFNNLSFTAWLLSLFVYSVLAVGFALRAWTYFSIRGRIIYSIGLAAICEYQNTKNIPPPGNDPAQN